MENNSIFWQRLRENLTPTFPRSKVTLLTGGLISSRTLANLDSLGLGPTVRVRIGKIIGYERENFIAWLKARSKGENPKLE